jgi:5,10-methylenetetrahydromethanopterin reductase
MSVKWGVWFEPTQPVARLCELAVHAEALGAEACLVADEGTERDVYVALTAIVLATERLTVAPAITNPFSRHPVATAAAIATLAELAPGRVWHGLGVGGSRVLDPLGVAPSKPYTALKETFESNSVLLSGGNVGSAQLPWFDADVPIAIAGRGPRVQRLAAERADWVILSAKGVDEMEHTARGIRSAGDAKIGWSAYLAYDAAERRKVLKHFSYMAVDAPPEIREAVGLTEDTTELVRAAMLSGDMELAATYLPDALVDLFAIAGSPSDCGAAIASCAEHFDMFLLPMNDEASSEEHITRSAVILNAI